jgi:hypothetical protein
VLHKTNTDHYIPATDREVRVQIGDVCCSFKCDNAEVLGNLGRLLGNFLCTNRVDTTIELEATDRLRPEETESAMARARYKHNGGEFRTTDSLITGRYDTTGSTISLKGEKNLLNPDLEVNAVNQLLSLSYYTACKARHNGNPPAMLVHSSAVLYNGWAVLFVGPCESGKSTIARMCDGRFGQAINDETVLLSRPHHDNGDNGTVTVYGVPHIGEIESRPNASAPLSCIMMLKQSHRTAARRLERMESYVRFLRQIITPAYIGQTDRRAIFSLMADFSNEITGAVPFYELEFTLDGEPLGKLLGELEESLDRRNGHGEKPDSLD